MRKLSLALAAVILCTGLCAQNITMHRTGDDEFVVAGVGAWIDFASSPGMECKIAVCTLPATPRRTEW